MRYGSVCSGIEAASAAWHQLRWVPAWFAEVEAFPSAVLSHRFPGVENLGDMTTIAARIAAGEVEAPDVLVGGTPCQAFSVAGLRQSLSDERGNLSLKFVELADAIDNIRRNRGQPESIVVWENVPGVLSTSDNAFGCFVAGLAGCESPISLASGQRWTDAGLVVGPRRTVAWRILDAQYFGLAQRRRRVFVVASARAGFDPASVLLEFDGVRRDSAPRREAREGTAARVGGGPEGGSIAGTVSSKWSKGTGGPAGDECYNLVSDVVGTLNHAGGHAVPGNCPQDWNAGMLLPVTHTLRAEGFDASEDGTGRGTPLVPVPFRKSRRAKSADDHETWVQDDIANTLNCHDIGDIRAVDVVAQPVTFMADDYKDGGYEPADTARPLTTIADRTRAAPIACVDVAGTMKACKDSGGWSNSADHAAAGYMQVTPTMQVRRLTPRECERLQGFPDDWTLVPVRGKPAADGPRYKALGNSMAVPVMRWIGQRISAEVPA